MCAWSAVISSRLHLNYWGPISGKSNTVRSCAGYRGEFGEKDVGEPDCGSTELSLFLIFGSLITLFYLLYRV